jgi:hypothetical protein
MVTFPDDVPTKSRAIEARDHTAAVKARGHSADFGIITIAKVNSVQIMRYVTRVISNGGTRVKYWRCQVSPKTYSNCCKKNFRGSVDHLSLRVVRLNERPPNPPAPSQYQRIAGNIAELPELLGKP